MFIVKVVGIALVATVIWVLLRNQHEPMAIQFNIVVGVILLWLVVSQLPPVIELFQRITARAPLRPEYVGIVLKIVGIAYLTEFGAQIAQDAGAGSIAAKVEMVGKVVILVLSIPVVMAVVELVLKLLPEV